MNNLETFTLQSSGTLRFSLASGTLPSAALLNIGGATPTLAGVIDVVARTGSLPNGSMTLITGTSIGGSTDITSLTLAAGLVGGFSISGNSLLLTLTDSTCGTACRAQSCRRAPGHANMQVVCNQNDGLVGTTNIARTDSRLAILYRGTQSDGSGSVNSIANTGSGGEIHIESGGVSRADDSSDATTANARAAVRLINSGTNPLRLVTASGTSVSNADTTAQSDAIRVEGGGNVFVEIAGSTSTQNGRAIFAKAGGSGKVDLDVTGGVHTSSTSTAVVSTSGIAGADEITIGSGVVVCRGTYAASACTAGSGTAISLAKGGTQSGSGSITNTGSVWGGISVSSLTVASTITNRSGGSIDGAFTGGAGSSTVSNAGSWTMRSAFDFGGTTDTDSFTNTGTGTFIVRHSGTTLAMNNLETFTLQAAGAGESGGIVRFSLASGSVPSAALLNIGGATPTLAGTIEVVTRSGSLPAATEITLLTGTSISTSVGITGLSLADSLGLEGKFSISGSNLILTIADPTCGTAAARTVTLPGHANMQVVCDHNDNLFNTTNITRSGARVAIIYRGTQNDGSGAVNSIANTGSGGEIHIETGSVSRADDASDSTTANARAAVRLMNSGTNALRLVMASSTSVANVDTSSQSHAVRVEGGGEVSLEIAGSTSATSGRAVFARAGGSGDVDLDISGGTHTSGGRVVSASLASGGTGKIDIDITGSTTVLHGGSSSAAVVSGSGIGGADEITIGSGAVVCRGSYAASACTASSGTAISLVKSGTQGGSGSITNTGSVWGGISVSSLTRASTITNNSGGSIDGAFTGGAGSSTVSNQGTWTMPSAFDFGSSSDTDTFTNTGTGTFIVRYAGTTLAMNNLETFTLQAAGTGESGGILRFSLASGSLPANALLNIGGATPTLAGVIDVITRDSSSLPASGQVTLITGTSISGSTDIASLSLADGLSGSLSISGNNLVLTFARMIATVNCGTAVARNPVVLPGHANMQVVCDHNDSLATTTNIARTDDRVAILYRGTQSNGTGSVNSIANTGSGGEIHIETGSVSRADDGSDASAANERAAVRLMNSGTDPLRLVVSSGASVSNVDTSSGSHGVYVSGGGEVSLEIGGSTSATSGRAVRARAGGSGDVDLDISGGMHTGSGRVVSASLASGGTGKVDIDITGSSTVLYGGGATAAVVSASGIAGADEITIASGVMVCRGSYSSSICTAETGNAISLAKSGTQGGSGSIMNTGSIWGGISVSSLTRASTITNNAGGSIDGAFTGGAGSSTVSNQGTWTMRGTFDFGGNSDTDSFTNTGTGTFIVRYDGTTLAMNNLESFTLQAAGATESGGILRFSLARGSLPNNALLNIGGATPTLAGAIDIITRDSSALPTSGMITLITGTSISGVDITSLSLASGVSGEFSISGSNLILTFTTPICGPSTARTPVLPGHADKQVVCNHEDGLTNASDIRIEDHRVAIIYRGTQNDGSGSVRSVMNIGSGGEIHIETGSVRRVDDTSDSTTANERAAVRLMNSGTDPLRLVVASGTSVANEDTTSGSHALHVEGGGKVTLEIEGSTTAMSGRAVFARAGGSGDVDLDISGGTHTSSGRVVSASLASTGTGKIDIDITGSSTVLHGGSNTAAVVSGSGIAGADEITIGSGVVVCRGTYSESACAAASGTAISLAKSGTQDESGLIRNSGSIWGGLSVSSLTVSSTIENQSGGSIDGTFTGGAGNSTVTNAGTWTMRNDFDFGSNSDSDSFTNTETGTFIVRYAGTTLAMNNLESFTLQASGTLRFSLSGGTPTSALLDIGAATPTLAGIIDIERAADVPSFTETITLITGTSISGTDIGGLSLAVGVAGRISLSGNNLVFKYASTALPPDAVTPPVVDPDGPAMGPACGTAVARSPVVLPGHANMQVVCDHNDSLSSTSDISRTGARLAILYRGTQSNGTGAVNSISHMGAGGEIHIESGSVSRADDASDATLVAERSAVRLLTGGTDPVRVVMSAGTSVANADTTDQSHGLQVEGGGDVFVEVAGSTSAQNGAAVFVQSGDAGTVDLDISGGTHTSSGNVVSASLGSSVGTGAVDIDITGSTVVHGGSASQAVVSASGLARVDEITIGAGVVVCRGSYSSSTCTAQTGDAISLAKSGAQAGSGRVRNSGRVWGGISVSTLAVDSTTENLSRGSIDGMFTGGSGNDVVSNAGVWTMTRNSDFGSGIDSFTNTGRLVIRYAGNTIALNGLEVFRQATGATLHLEIDPSSGLPASGSALVDVGSASGTVAGSMSLRVLDTVSTQALRSLVEALGSDTQRSVFASGHSLAFASSLNLSGGLSRNDDNTNILYDLARPEPPATVDPEPEPPAPSEPPEPSGPPEPPAVPEELNPQARAAEAYDLVVQTSWFAARALLRSLATSSCDTQYAYSHQNKQQEAENMTLAKGGCAWMNISTRLFTSQRNSKETASNISGGLRLPLGESGWDLTTTVAYEYSNVGFNGGRGTGHRGLVGFAASAGGDKPWNLDIGLTVQGGTYEMERTNLTLTPAGAPDMVMLGGHGTVEYAFSEVEERQMWWALIPRLRTDAVMLWGDGSTEVDTGLQVRDVEEVMVSLKPSVEMRFGGQTRLGLLESWMEVGFVGFATDPELDYQIATRADRSRPFGGTMERFWGEAALGVRLIRGSGTEFSLFWDGVFADDSRSNGLTLELKAAF